jgi:hypothetical protein
MKGIPITSQFEPGKDDVTEDIEDAEGHGFRWPVEPTEDDTEGHGIRWPMEPTEDDTEGHGLNGRV